LLRAQDLLKGAIDMHVHVNPDTKERIFDSYEAAQQAKDCGMSAVVIKAHDTITADIASTANKVIEGVTLYGGITLNQSIGGFNPETVEKALGRGAKIVWFPTSSSASHWKSRNKPYADKLSIFKDGIDNPGEILTEVIEICKLIANADAILATGHMCYTEVMALLDVANKVGVKKFLVNHPQNRSVGMGPKEQKEAAERGAYMEQCFNFVTPHLPLIKPDDFVEAIRAVGPEKCVMATDMGQIDNFYPAEGLRVFIRMMQERGISDEDIRMMISKNPRKLLNIE
jgi:hypothetical protein